MDTCGLFWQSIVPDLLDLPSILMVDDLLDGWVIWMYVNFGNSCTSVSWMNDKYDNVFISMIGGVHWP